MNSFNFTEHNNLMNRCQEHINRGKIAAVNINDANLICYEDGDIYKYKFNDWVLIENKANAGKGYNQISCNGKHIYRHRIIARAFLNLDIEDTKQQIDHIDSNRINNNINNLRIVNNQQNHFNRTSAKGYSWNKRDKKYYAYIMLNNKNIYLGYFNTPEDARQAYINGKLIYHQIN